MRVEKMQNNNYNTSFGIKLVLRNGVYPHKFFEEPLPEELQKLVQTVETRTADKKGTIYISGLWNDWGHRPENMNIYFNHGSYNDGVTLYGAYKECYPQNTDKFIDMLVKLTDAFKMRESVVRATKNTRMRIEKLQTEVNKIFTDLSDRVDKNFGYSRRAIFANDVLEESCGLSPAQNDFQSLINDFREDKQLQKQFLSNV